MVQLCVALLVIGIVFLLMEMWLPGVEYFAAIGIGLHRGLAFAGDPIAGFDELGSHLLHPLAIACEPPMLCHSPHRAAVVLVVVARFMAANTVEDAILALEVAC